MQADTLHPDINLGVIYFGMSIYTKFMGAEQSHVSVDPDAFHRNFSIEHSISMWDKTPPKNSEYYDGKRFFKVGKDKYTRYTPGYLYGWTDKEEDEDDDFVLLKSELSAIEVKQAALVARVKPSSCSVTNNPELCFNKDVLG